MNPSHVLIAGEVFEYPEKAPYVSMDCGEQGVLRYEPARDAVQCHVCGEWRNTLGSHLRVHAISGRAYKIRYGLRITTPLCAPSFSAKMKNAGGSDERMAIVRSGRRSTAKVGGNGYRLERESVNARGVCLAQLGADFYNLRDRLGRTPSLEEFCASRKVSAGYVLGAFDKTWNQLVEFWHAIPNKQAGSLKWSEVALIELLRDFYVKTGKLPSQRNRSPGVPNRSTYVRRFGSWVAACHAAGLGLPLERNKERAARFGGISAMRATSNRRQIETERTYGVGA